MSNPGPLQLAILEHLRKNGRSSAQAVAQAVGTTLASARDALTTLQNKGLVVKSPVSFELAEGHKKAKGSK